MKKRQAKMAGEKRDWRSGEKELLTSAHPNAVDAMRKYRDALERKFASKGNVTLELGQGEFYHYSCPSEFVAQLGPGPVSADAFAKCYSRTALRTGSRGTSGIELCGWTGPAVRDQATKLLAIVSMAMLIVNELLAHPNKRVSMTRIGRKVAMINGIDGKNLAGGKGTPLELAAKNITKWWTEKRQKFLDELPFSEGQKHIVISTKIVLECHERFIIGGEGKDCDEAARAAKVGLFMDGLKALKADIDMVRAASHAAVLELVADMKTDKT